MGLDLAQVVASLRVEFLPERLLLHGNLRAEAGFLDLLSDVDSAGYLGKATLLSER